MGQTFWHFPQSMHFSLSTKSMYLPCPATLCMVLMGQNEHHALGAMMIPKRMATDVVRRHI
jgi:hypothetical protein